MSCALAQDQPGAKDGVPRWPEGAHQLHARYMTIADFDTAKRQITLDIVQHKGGVLSQWAKTARPGDKIGTMGPGGRLYFRRSPAIFWAVT